MANMSYCRFENTLQNLWDCYEHLDDPAYLSPSEEDARLALIKLCQQIAFFSDSVLT